MSWNGCEYLILSRTQAGFERCDADAGFVIVAGTVPTEETPWFVCWRHGDDLRGELIEMEMDHVGPVQPLGPAPDDAIESGRWYTV